MIRELTQKVSARTLDSYAAIKSLDGTSTVVEKAFISRDDVSTVKELAKHLQENGIDPSAAYDDAEDFITEFGLDDFR